MTQRRRLDAFLLDAAREKGVEVREGVRVAIEPDNTVVLGSGERVSADVIVGADGANGVTREGASGSGRASSTASPTRATSKYPVCSTGNATRAGSYSSSRTSPADTPGSSPRATTRTSESEGGRARGRSCASIFAVPARAHGLDPTPLVEGLRGHRLPLRRPGRAIAGERALLVGDAAGLIDPVSGDGMYECFVSSRLAAEAILDLLAGRARRRLLPYEVAVDAELVAAPSTPRGS